MFLIMLHLSLALLRQICENQRGTSETVLSSVICRRAVPGKARHFKKTHRSRWLDAGRIFKPEEIRAHPETTRFGTARFLIEVLEAC